VEIRVFITSFFIIINSLIIEKRTVGRDMRLDTIEQLWLASLKMGMEIRKKTGMKLSHPFELLRSAKPLLNECRLDEKAEPEILAHAEALIHSAQREIYIAGEALGKNFIEGWDDVFDRIEKGEKIGKFPISKPSFHPGMPRGKWVKISLTKGLGARKLREIAKSHGLKVEKRSGGDYLLIGEPRSLHGAIRSIRALLRGEVQRK
jgi:hypothetical protein